jgi:hypothetical protein
MADLFHGVFPPFVMSRGFLAVGGLAKRPSGSKQSAVAGSLAMDNAKAL